MVLFLWCIRWIGYDPSGALPIGGWPLEPHLFGGRLVLGPWFGRPLKETRFSSGELLLGRFGGGPKRSLPSFNREVMI